MVKLHYCTMTGRDNMAFLLKDIIKIVNPYFDSINIVDTGSTDDTKDLPANIFKLDNWNDDWIRAYMEVVKNIPINDWFLFMDSDEVPNKLLLENIKNVITNAEIKNKNINCLGLRSKIHVINWDNSIYTNTLKEDDKEPVWRKYVLLKKLNGLSAKTTGGHCAYTQTNLIIDKAPWNMWYCHYKTNYTTCRSTFTHGFRFPFSFNGLHLPENTELINNFKTKVKLNTVNDFMDYLDGEMNESDSEIFKIWEKSKESVKQNIYEILIKYRKIKIKPKICDCCY